MRAAAEVNGIAQGVEQLIDQLDVVPWSPEDGGASKLEPPTRGICVNLVVVVRHRAEQCTP